MENRRPVVIALVLVVTLVLAPQCMAYDNVVTHRIINEYAYDDFVANDMKGDDFRYAFLDGTEQLNGYDMDRYTGSPTSYLKMSLKDWVIEGGTTGDEPVYVVLHHFYDPTKEPHYLTDVIGDNWVNPRGDAVQWTVANDNYKSLTWAKEYYKKAMASTDAGNGLYGLTWLCLGEAMHMVSDMTVPAHVRNDAHPPFLQKAEPYEKLCEDAVLVRSCAETGTPFQSVDYLDGDISSLMRSVAAQTSANFLTDDTIPSFQYQFTTPTRFHLAPYVYKYPTPKLDDPAILNLERPGQYYVNYYYWPVDHQATPAAKELIVATNMQISYKGNDNKIWTSWLPAHMVALDPVALKAQASTLIPTATKASADVLNVFLPRFSVEVDSMTPDPQAGGNYLVAGRILLRPNSFWASGKDVYIRNGAHIMVNDVDYHVTVADNLYGKEDPAYDQLNYVKYSVPAKAGDKVQIYYDLGGYKVFSMKYTVGGATAVPAGTVTTTPTAGPSYGKEYQGSYVEVDKPVFVYSGGMTETLGLLVPEDPLAPGQSFLLTVFQGMEGGSESPRMLPDDERGRMLEFYVERNVTLTINTGGLATQDFHQDVRAKGSYVAAELPFTVRSNARPGSYTVTVIAADEYGKTRSATFEIRVD